MARVCNTLGRRTGVGKRGGGEGKKGGGGGEEGKCGERGGGGCRVGVVRFYVCVESML